jgi:thiamine-monophosphate kinase
VDAAGAAAGVAVTRIGRIEAAPGLRVVDTDGRPVEGLDLSGFDHFRHGG